MRIWAGAWKIFSCHRKVILPQKQHQSINSRENGKLNNILYWCSALRLERYVTQWKYRSCINNMRFKQGRGSREVLVVFWLCAFAGKKQVCKVNMAIEGCLKGEKINYLVFPPVLWGLWENPSWSWPLTVWILTTSSGQYSNRQWPA